MFLSYWGILAPICDNEGCGFPRWIPVAVWHASHGLQLEDALIRNGNDEDLIKEMHQQLGVASEIDGFSPQIVLLLPLSCHLSCISQPGSSGFPLKKWRPTFLPDGFGGCFHLVAITSPAGWYPRFHHPTSYVFDDDDDDGWSSSFSLVICSSIIWWYPQLSSSSIPDTHIFAVFRTPVGACWSMIIGDYTTQYIRNYHELSLSILGILMNQAGSPDPQGRPRIATPLPGPVALHFWAARGPWRPTAMERTGKQAKQLSWPKTFKNWGILLIWPTHKLNFWP